MADSSFMCQLPNCRLHAQGGRDGIDEDFLFPRWKQSRQIENERQLGCNLNIGTDPLKSRLDTGNGSGAERSSHLERAHLIHIDLSAIARSLN